MTTATLTPELRADLADYHVLAAYDRERFYRYGDMAGSRRAREINRRAGALIDQGAHVDREGHLPESTPAELAEAWGRIALPRIKRVLSETYRLHTPYTKATLTAWSATKMRLGLTTEETA